MIRTKKTAAILVVILLIASSIGCSRQPQKPTPKSEEGPPEQPKVIEELESDLLKIMALADKVPYFKRVIVEEMKIEEEKKKEQAQMSQESKPQGEEQQGQQPQGEGAGSKPQEQGGGSQQEEKPKPMTIEESVLDEILKREKESDQKKEDKPPKDIAETWKNINTTIKGLHDKWNVLEPLLIQQPLASEVIKEFENNLDKLTNLGIENNYFGTITTANRLTFYLPKFMAVFKKDVPPTVYTLKFYVRDVVLNSAVNNYDQAKESLNQIKEQGQSLKSDLIEKKAKDTADKFDASVTNLQNSIEKKDINLIKINAAIVMKNIMLMKDDLAASM